MIDSVTIVEVGTRDGFQSVGPVIPTSRKIELLTGLYETGLRRIETTSFVSPTAVPQLADAAEIVAAGAALPGLRSQVLVPTTRQAERALAADAGELCFVLSVSDAHNRSNVRRSPAESVAEYRAIAAMMPDGMAMRLNVATAFDCPYQGRIDERDTIALLGDLVDVLPQAEVALCDTTGRVTPGHVETLFGMAVAAFPQVAGWAFHAHDTFGLGAANVLAAYKAGVRVFDASVAGLGGCPFAPGATGNVATEDLVWMFDGMGIQTGIALDRLVDAAREVAALPGASVGGRVREALAAAACRRKSAAA